MIYNELMKYDVLVPQSKRQYSSFKNLRIYSVKQIRIN